MPISDNECDDFDVEYGGGYGDMGDMGDMGDVGGDGMGQPMSKAEQRRVSGTECMRGKGPVTLQFNLGG